MSGIPGRARKEKMKKQPKFVQIEVANKILCALDEDGDVWQWVPDNPSYPARERRKWFKYSSERIDEKI